MYSMVNDHFDFEDIRTDEPLEDNRQRVFSADGIGLLMAGNAMVASTICHGELSAGDWE
jgi:hypothetical protein